MKRCNPKPFKTVEEQIAILEGRGITVPDREAAAAFLLGENYYTVVNGYKDAFIDRQATNLAGEDRFFPGTDFDSFRLLYSFDEALRSRTMDILLEAENVMKTATVYAFSSVHKDVESYLDPACYCQKADYRRAPERYTRGLIRLLTTLQGIRDNNVHKPYIDHYTREYKCLPLWVASKCLTFGNMSAFFDYQQQRIKTRTCVNMARALGKNVVRQKNLEYAFHTLPEFRNICAHGERLYCARAGKQADKGFVQLVRALKTATTDEHLAEYVLDVIALIDDVVRQVPSLERVIYDGLGTSRRDLLELVA